MALKAKARPEKDRSERWLLTYADLITLLMVFFVILYSFSIIDVQRFLNLRGSLDRAFNQGVLAGLNTTSLSEAASNGTVSVRIARQDAKAAAASQLQKVADAVADGDGILINEVTQGITISLPADVLFQSGTAQLKPQAVPVLAAFARQLKDVGNPIEIIGNTDDLTPLNTNSTFRDNWLMGQARAYAVLRELVDRNTFPEDRLSIWSKAQYSPLSANDSPEGRALNRRVDLLVVFPQGSDVAPAAAPAAAEPVRQPAPAGAAPAPATAPAPAAAAGH